VVAGGTFFGRWIPHQVTVVWAWGDMTEVLWDLPEAASTMVFPVLAVPLTTSSAIPLLGESFLPYAPRVSYDHLLSLNHHLLGRAN